MFFILSKVLAFLLTPGFWILVLLAFAWFNSRLRKKLLGGALIMFLFFSNGFILNLALHFWELEKNELPQSASIAIVLGGYSSFNKELNQLEFDSAVDRILLPLQWYRSGKIQKLLLSGGSGEFTKQTYSEQQKVAEFLFECGVPKADIIVEPKSQNTRENALFTSLLIDSISVNPEKVVLVTSGIHMRRSLACFSKVGLDLYPCPVDFNSVSIKEKATFRYIVLPDMHALLGWNYFLHELVGYITYWIMDYI